MSTYAYKAPSTRTASTSTYIRPARTPAQLAALRRAKRRLSAKLAAEAPELSKSARAAAARALELAMDELVTDLTKGNHEPRKIQRLTSVKSRKTKSSSLTPTPRLKRAMAEATTIQYGRFATADELFESLGQASQK